MYLRVWARGIYTYKHTSTHTHTHTHKHLPPTFPPNQRLHDPLTQPNHPHNLSLPVARTYTHTSLNTRTRAPAHTHKHTHTNTHFGRTYSQAHTHTHTHIHTFGMLCVCVCACVCMGFAWVWVHVMAFMCRVLPWGEYSNIDWSIWYVAESIHVDIAFMCGHTRTFTHTLTFSLIHSPHTLARTHTNTQTTHHTSRVHTSKQQPRTAFSWALSRGPASFWPAPGFSPWSRLRNLHSPSRGTFPWLADSRQCWCTRTPHTWHWVRVENMR